MSVAAKLKALSEIDLSQSIAEINKLKESLDSAASASQSLAAANRAAGAAAQGAAANEDALAKARQAQAAMTKSNTQATRDAYAAAYKQMSDLEKKQFEMDDRLKELNQLYGKAGITDAQLAAKLADYERAKEVFLQAERDQQANPTQPTPSLTPTAYSTQDLSGLVREALGQLNISTDTAVVQELQNLSTLMESYKWNKPNTTFQIDFKQYGEQVDPSELVDAIERAMRTAI